MPTKIFYYTGTGNSLWTARTIAEKLDNADIEFMSNNAEERKSVADYDTVGFVFPVYIWGVPPNVLRFIDKLSDFDPKYCFAVVTNGGQVSKTLIQLKEVLRNKKISLNSGFGITMPSNYIPWGGPGSAEKQQERFNTAATKIETIADVVTNRETRPMEKGPLWHRILFTLFYKMSFNHINKMDSKFWVDEKCNSCKICEQVCPTKNIIIVNGKPSWNQKCDQCYACLQWCPREAIQYGKKTPQYERYRHPEIKLKDMMR